MDEVSEQDFDQIMAVNVKGTWLCIREEVRVMLGQGSGSIVNMSSIGGLRGSSGMGAYQATKHAVIGLAIPGGVEARIAATPLRKAGTGPEAGATASFLLSDRAPVPSGP